jgi:hypothetical protein
MEPMNLTCMLFSAIRKEMRRPASRRASLIRIKGSINCEVRNMDRDGDFLGGGSCLVGMRSGNEDDGSAAWDAVAASTANLAEKDIEHDCRHVSTGAGSGCGAGKEWQRTCEDPQEDVVHNRRRPCLRVGDVRRLRVRGLRVPPLVCSVVRRRRHAVQRVWC